MAHVFSNKHGLSRLKLLVMLTNENKVIELSEEKFLILRYLIKQKKSMITIIIAIMSKMKTTIKPRMKSQRKQEMITTIKMV